MAADGTRAGRPWPWPGPLGAPACRTHTHTSGAPPELRDPEKQRRTRSAGRRRHTPGRAWVLMPRRRRARRRSLRGRVRAPASRLLPREGRPTLGALTPGSPRRRAQPHRTGPLGPKRRGVQGLGSFWKEPRGVRDPQSPQSPQRGAGALRASRLRAPRATALPPCGWGPRPGPARRPLRLHHSSRGLGPPTLVLLLLPILSPPPYPPPPGSAPRLTRRAGAHSLGHALARGAGPPSWLCGFGFARRATRGLSASQNGPATGFPPGTRVPREWSASASTRRHGEGRGGSLGQMQPVR